MARFEWDEPKRRSVIQAHGVDFIDAVGIFDGNVIIEPDTRRNYGEDREIAIGESEGSYYVVVFTRRKDVLRVITSWRAGRRAGRRYQELYGGRGSGNA